MRGGGESLTSARVAGAGRQDADTDQDGPRCSPCREQLCGRARTWAVRCQQLELRGSGRFTSSQVMWSDPWCQPESPGKQVCPSCFLDRRAAVQRMSRGRGMGTLEQPETRNRERQAEPERGCLPISSHLLGPLKAAHCSGWAQHHRLNRYESEQTPGDGGKQRSLVCSLWGCQDLAHNLATERASSRWMTLVSFICWCVLRFIFKKSLSKNIHRLHAI